MYTVFVGDSFCNAYNYNDWVHYQKPFTVGSQRTPWPDLVKTARKTKIAPYGFGGKSWWFSWSSFWYNFHEHMNEVDSIIFCHTESGRINSNIESNQDLPNNFWVQNCSSEIKNLYKSHLQYFHDQNFNDWAQQRFFEFLRQHFSHIKTVHLHCFRQSVAWSKLLPGVVFNTPLQVIALGGVPGTMEQAVSRITASKNSLDNHLTDANNKTLANVIVRALDNYSPGIYSLDLDEFEIPNHSVVNEYLSETFHYGKYRDE